MARLPEETARSAGGIPKPATGVRESAIRAGRGVSRPGRRGRLVRLCAVKTRSRPPETTVRPRIRVTRAGEILLGPGKADLLDAIRRSGRLRGAADELGMSYMRAWKLVQMLNRGFREPLVRTERGGAGHGKTALTPMGESVLSLYRAMESSSRAAIRPAWKRMRSLLAS